MKVENAERLFWKRDKGHSIVKCSLEVELERKVWRIIIQKKILWHAEEIEAGLGEFALERDNILRSEEGKCASRWKRDHIDRRILASIEKNWIKIMAWR